MRYLLLLLLGWSMQAAEVDFARAHEEIINALAGFVKVETVNPPGNETEGALYLKQFLDKAGIASEVLELEKGRGNLVARIKGSGKKKPILLMGHLDVVPAEREKWTVDPFGGIIKDGFLYGRGSIDDKAMTVACMQLLIELKRQNRQLDRDVIFLAEAGEEGTTYVGIDYMVSKHWEKIDAEFGLNEGGTTRVVGDKVQYVGVATTEKVPRPMLLNAKGTSGHGSVPSQDNAIVHLSDAVAKAGKWQGPMRLNETTREFFKRYATIAPPEEKYFYENVENPAETERVQRFFLVNRPRHAAMLRSTVTPTILKGGFRSNVIPGDGVATLDVRVLPDEDVESFRNQLQNAIGNPRVEVILASNKARPAAPPTKLDTEMFAALEKAQKKLFPEAISLPLMTVGATDSAQLRAKGMQVYGLGTLVTEEDAMKMHGNDERVSVEGLRKFFELLYHAVTEVAATKGN